MYALANFTISTDRKSRGPDPCRALCSMERIDYATNFSLSGIAGKNVSARKFIA
jgi:hypothetical protein